MLWTTDQKEELSRAYIQAIAAKAGYATEKITIDKDSIDLIIRAGKRLVDSSVFEKVTLEVQAKATASPNEKDNCYKFPLSKKNYDDLKSNSMVPRIIVLYIMPQGAEDWINVDESQLTLRKCAYWVSIKGLGDNANTTSVTIDIPKDNIFNITTLEQLMIKASKGEEL